MRIIETDRQGRVWSVEFAPLESRACARFVAYLAAGLTIQAAAGWALRRMPRTSRTAGFVTHPSEGTLPSTPRPR